MNKICKEYISDAKKFFPIMGKSERAYLRGIVSELEDCIERENITSKQELFEKYRQPYDLANDYYCRFETDEIVKKIKISKYIKVLISVLIVITLIASSIFIYFWSENHNRMIKEEMVDVEQISNNNLSEIEQESTVYDKIDSDDFIYEDDEVIDSDETIE